MVAPRETFYYQAEVRVAAALLAAAALVLAGRLLALPLRPPPAVGLEVEPLQIDLNRADLQALTLLPGVGPVTAADLVRGRPYRTWQDVEQAIGADKAAGVRGWAILGPALGSGERPGR